MPLRGLHDAEVRGVILQTNSQGHNIGRGIGDCQGILNSHGGFQNRHQPDGLPHIRHLANAGDPAINFHYLLRPLNFRNEDQIRFFRNNFIEVGQTKWQLVNAHHALHAAKIYRS